MFLGNTNYIIVMVIAMAIGGLAQLGISRANKKYSRIPLANGMTGAQVAQRILQSNNIASTDGRVSRGAVGIQQVSGSLTDHYDPSSGIVSLSDSVYGASTVAAAAVAAHECGHAIQDAHGYVFGRIRTALVPAVNFSSRFSMILIIGGFFLGLAPRSLGFYALWAGIILYSAAVLFQIVTLPVEIDASRRAMGQLRDLAILGPDELSGGRSMLTAAAMTYVAAALVSLLYLAFYLSLGSRRS
ncbi:MAG: zinc metallopeptidase [Actinomycetia bacterium]|nr:zinc metallopeptidase [Actinomycetes bacterium]